MIRSNLNRELTIFCFQWIDPAAGNCGLWATQLLPPGNQDAMDLAVAYRKHINAHKST